MTIASKCRALLMAAGVAIAPAFAATDGPVTAGESIDALAASYAFSEGHRLDAENRRAVIARYGRYIVVSFLSREDERGGVSHIVYDPVRKVVVDFRVEE